MSLKTSIYVSLSLSTSLSLYLSNHRLFLSPPSFLLASVMLVGLCPLLLPPFPVHKPSSRPRSLPRHNMRTRRHAYSSPSDGITFAIRPLRPLKRAYLWNSPACRDSSTVAKRPRKVGDDTGQKGQGSYCGILVFHDDILVSIMTALSSTGTRPADLINAMLTCKRFCAAATHRQVLACASLSVLDVKASRWSDGAHQFLNKSAEAGNAEACYTLGMIAFYCLRDWIGGARNIAKAALFSHAAALHSLAVIQFNGSGGSRKDKDLAAGVGWLARAASLGHIDAMRELGHCLQDGYGVKKNVREGRRLLLAANAREAVAAMVALPPDAAAAALHIASSAGSNRSSPSSVPGFPLHHVHYRSAITKQEATRIFAATSLSPSTIADIFASIQRHPAYRSLHGRGCSLLSDFGCNVPLAKPHVANEFLLDWFSMRPPSYQGLRLCSYMNCGRPETRRHEFRRCSACGLANYCSRACQALDWKLRHKLICNPPPLADWEDRDGAEEGNVGDEIAIDNLDEL